MSLEVIEIGAIQKLGCGFLFAFHSNYGNILHCLRDYSDLLAENRGIFIPHLYLVPPQGVTPSEFLKVFDAGKTRMIGLPYGEKTTKIC